MKRVHELHGLYLLIAVCCLLLAVGCFDVFNTSDNEQKALPDGYGSITLNINGIGNARAILPDNDEFAAKVVKYQISITDIITFSYTSDILEQDDFPLEPIEVPVGTYLVAVAGFDENDNPVAMMIDGVEVVNGENSVVDVALIPYINTGKTDDVINQGGFSWDITLPDNLEEAYMTITPQSGTEGMFEEFFGDADPLVLYFIGGLENVALEAFMALPSGNYDVVFTLIKDGGSRAITWPETLHIFLNLTNRFVQDFSDYDFPKVGFKVTLDYNDDDDETGTVSEYLFHGETLEDVFTLLEPTNEKEELVFKGWYIVEDGEPTDTEWEIDAPVERELDLIAVWREPKTVVVGIQNGTLNAGSNGSVTFHLTTEYIADGTYSASVTNLPAGVTVGNSGNVTINNNSGTLTLAGNTSTVQGTTNTLTLTIDGATSAAFTLTIGAPKTVTVGSQNGTLNAGSAGSVTFPVTTANIANGTYSATVSNRPTGVTVSGQVTINNNSGTLTLAGNTSTVQGTTNTLTLTINGATSAAFTLTIGPPKSVTVGSQVGELEAGVAGSVTFPVTTANIANGTYDATVSNRPTGVTVSGQVTINNNSGTLTLDGSTSTAAGTTSTLRLTIDGTQSAAFTLTILPPKTVTVGSQNGTLEAGVAGSVTFPVTTVRITNGTYNVTVTNLPTGVTVGNSGNLTINNNFGTLTLAGNTSTVQGTTNTLTLTIDGTQSAAFTLTILPPKSVSVGTQNGRLDAGVDTCVSFSVTTVSIANGTYAASVANLPMGVTVWNSGNVTINNNSGTLTLRGSEFTVQGTTTTLTLTIDGTTSAAFTLTISPRKTVTVGNQVGTLRPGVAGTVTFPVTTANIANGNYRVYQGYSQWPQGVSVGNPNREITINNNSGTLTLAGDTSTLQGIYTFYIQIDDTNSEPFSLAIGTGQKVVTVGNPNRILKPGVAGTVTFPVTTANILNGTYSASVTNLPAGVTVGNSGNVTINNNSGTLTLAGNTSTVAGTTTTLRLTIDGTQSAAFTLIIFNTGSGTSIVGRWALPNLPTSCVYEFTSGGDFLNIAGLSGFTYNVTGSTLYFYYSGAGQVGTHSFYLNLDRDMVTFSGGGFLSDGVYIRMP